MLKLRPIVHCIALLALSPGLPARAASTPIPHSTQTVRVKPFKILMLTLDERPPNYDHVVSLAAVAGSGIELIIPPLGLMPPSLQAVRTPYDFASIQSWLDAHYDEADAAVISPEFFLYGGLVRSREMDIDTATAISRLASLEAILKRNPAKAYLFTVLSRVAPTQGEGQQYSDQDWANITAYSAAADELTQTQDPVRKAQLQAQVTALLQAIPPAFFTQYQNKVARDQAVRTKLLDLLPEVAAIVFSQEDCAPFGLHRQAKASLESALATLSAADRAKAPVITGLDEVASLLLGRAYLDGARVLPGSIPIQVIPSDPSGMNLVSAYEDIPVEANLLAHLQIFPQFRLADAADIHPARLFIHTFAQSGQQDWESMPAPSSDPSQDAIPSDFLSQITQDSYVMDIKYSNGGDPNLVNALASRLGIQTVHYSGWNTTGNSMDILGSIAVRSAAENTGTIDPAASLAYDRIKALDSMYDAVVRTSLRLVAQDWGDNEWSLDQNSSFYANQATSLLRGLAGRLGYPADLTGELKVDFPLDRLFEARISPK